jgi:DNA replication protein DnaC
MNEPLRIGDVIAPLLTRMQKLQDDDAFWTEREALLADMAAQEQRRKARQIAEEQEARAFQVPAAYREPFDEKRAKLSRTIINEVQAWKPSLGTGIGLTGSTGLGKTRLLISKLLTLDCTWLYLPATHLAKCVARQYNDDYTVANAAFITLRDARQVKVLMLDDIGHENATESVSSELMEIVEFRTARQKPILWTTNMTSKEIAACHPKRALPMIRRLCEHCWVPKPERES